VRLRDLVDGARRRLEAAGIAPAEAALDAELLARDVLGWDRATWLARRDDPESSVDLEVRATPGQGAFAAGFEPLVARRLAREPMAYIRGTQEFYGREFLVGPGVLIPRPETELVIDAARPALAGRPSPRVADIGTGSGCLAITLALEVPAAHVVATDVASDALRIARGNAAVHRVATRVRFRKTAYLVDVLGPFDAVVSNPPYVRETDASALPPEVRDYEPEGALFGGSDGLRDLRAVAAAAAQTLASGGVLVMEFGLGQVDAVRDLVAAAGLVDAEVRHDLQGIPRVVVASRPR
jgi:release factor glutamine methyltransferase